MAPPSRPESGLRPCRSSLRFRTRRSRFCCRKATRPPRLPRGRGSVFCSRSQRARAAARAERGQKRVLNRGATLFSQGSCPKQRHLPDRVRPHPRVHARLRARDQLAYGIRPFRRRPEVFGGAPHVWSGMAASNRAVVHLPGKALRDLAAQIPALALALIDGLVFQGQVLFDYGADARHPFDHERLSHLLLHLADLTASKRTAAC